MTPYPHPYLAYRALILTLSWASVADEQGTGTKHAHVNVIKWARCTVYIMMLVYHPLATMASLLLQSRRDV